MIGITSLNGSSLWQNRNSLWQYNNSLSLNRNSQFLDTLYPNSRTLQPKSHTANMNSLVQRSYDLRILQKMGQTVSAYGNAAQIKGFDDAVVNSISPLRDSRYTYSFFDLFG